MQICPKCGYKRKPIEGVPDWQCPGCGVAYCKIETGRLRQNHSVFVKTTPKQKSSKLWFFLLLILTGAGFYWKTHHPKSQISSPQISEETDTSATSSTAAKLSKDPIQVLLEGKIPSFESNGYSITPLASFELEAKVLSKENYRLGRPSDLSPTDLALGWGVMATDEMLDKIKISQSNRWFYWHVDDGFTEELAHQVSTHASNMHIIPASPAVEKALSSVKTGQVVYIKGYLIEANASDGWKWHSSLSREDTGDGACELVWVKDLKIR